MEFKRIVTEREERRVAPGDVVVQNGTRHAWRNRGTEPAAILSVMVGADPEPA